MPTEMRDGYGRLPKGFTDRRPIGPLEAVASTPERAAESLCELATSKSAIGHHVHLINAYTVAIADKDPAFATVLSGHSINLPDGKPLTWVSRMRRDAVPLSQVRGLTFMLNVFNQGREHGVRHYLLGSTEDVLRKLESNLLDQFPGTTIVGSHSPPFRPLTADEYAQQDADIVASGADVVWVGLGTPKQDHESKRLAESIPVVAVAVGAAFDFAAGTVKEAPALFQRIGMEWLYRFASEPRRLWKRYVFGNVRFVVSTVRGKHRRPRSS